jgi:glycopeptide antibiotics resistance protein
MSRPLLPLKAGAIVFTLLWTAWMMWWSGSFSSADVVILALCGAAVGYLWYRAMRWQFERMGMLPRKDDSAGAS